jgi:hypothetical protein
MACPQVYNCSKCTPASPASVHCSKQQSTEYALPFFPFACGLVRWYSELWFASQQQGFTSLETWIFEFLAKSADLDATVLTVSLRHMWDARNKIRKENCTICPSILVARIKAYIDMIVEISLFSSPTIGVSPLWQVHELHCRKVRFSLMLILPYLLRLDRLLQTWWFETIWVCVWLTCNDNLPNITLPELA